MEQGQLESTTFQGKLEEMVEKKIYKETDFGISEIYQIYMGNCSPVVAECRLHNEDYEDFNAIVKISRFKTKVITGESEDKIQEMFANYVENCNQ